MAASRNNPTTVRRGFTLIELLVTIGIMGVLIALTVTVGANVMSGRMERAAEDLVVNRIGKSMLMPQWKSVIEDARKTRQFTPKLLALADNDRERAQVIYIKFRLQQEFPVSFAEVKQDPLYQQGYIDRPTPYPADRLPDTFGVDEESRLKESSACLYMILSRSRRGSASDMDSAFGSGETARVLIANEPVYYLVDPWGSPLAFVRWPTGVPALQDRPDPLDPRKKLVPNVSGWSTANANVFADLCHAIDPDKSFNLYPIVVSCGRGAAKIDDRKNKLISQGLALSLFDLSGDYTTSGARDNIMSGN